MWLPQCRIKLPSLIAELDMAYDCHRDPFLEIRLLVSYKDRRFHPFPAMTGTKAAVIVAAGHHNDLLVH